MDLRTCKKCLLYEIAEGAAYESIKSYLGGMDLSFKTDEETYRRRLKSCKSCDMLFEAMCRKCGCYVEARAANKDLHCPKSDPLW